MKPVLLALAAATLGSVAYHAGQKVVPPTVHPLGILVAAWGVALAALGELAGFSKEAGAFLAGFSLASSPYREAMNARLTGIRDFLLLFFFIDLGARLELSTLGA